jgi:hypothetical protein
MSQKLAAAVTRSAAATRPDPLFGARRLRGQISDAGLVFRALPEVIGSGQIFGIDKQRPRFGRTREPRLADGAPFHMAPDEEITEPPRWDHSK